jgi:outer membrane lipoprotein-sorting protein
MTKMKLRQPRIGALLMLSSVLMVLATAPIARAQTLVREGLIASGSIENATASEANVADIIRRVTERNRVQREQLHSYSAVRTYEVQTSDGQVYAEDVVRVDYRAPGKMTFDKLNEQGPWIVRHLVFDRLLQSEQETLLGQERREAAISDENYTFVFVREANIGSDPCYVLRVQPKRAGNYLFEGELWIDERDYGIAKMSGHPAKRVSFWIDDANFVREYQKIGGFWLPYRDESSANFRTHGTRVLRVDHTQYVINSASAPATGTPRPAEPKLAAAY